MLSLHPDWNDQQWEEWEDSTAVVPLPLLDVLIDASNLLAEDTRLTWQHRKFWERVRDKSRVIFKARPPVDTGAEYGTLGAPATMEKAAYLRAVDEATDIYAYIQLTGRQVAVQLSKKKARELVRQIEDDVIAEWTSDSCRLIVGQQEAS